MACSKRLLYSISAALGFLLLSAFALIASSAGSPRSLSQQFQFHVCPSGPPLQLPVTRKFQPLTPLWRAQSDTSSWESLLSPPNGGMLKVRTSNGTITDYGISMFHQLHCLSMLRGVIFPSISQHHGASTSSLPHSDNAHEDSVHWAHCFDYIAQAIICSADDTIEPPHLAIDKNGERILIVDGMGHTHQCRDPEPLWRAVSDSRAQPIDVTRVKNTVRQS
ncbi:uncharacterized protein BO97DRAFT_359181, partial [Aspergillus homomorphus CBS 101889]